MSLELMLLIFVSHEGNFPLYTEVLAKIAPWFFTLDHHNYARWLPVYLRDMTTLQRTHPEVAREVATLCGKQNCAFLFKDSHRPGTWAG